MKVVPLGSADQPPLLLLDLIHKLRVKDVMMREVITVDRAATLREVQRLLKAKGITGVPVVEDGRLFGLVSIDDILNALEAGTIDEPVGAHMSTQIVVLEEDMPLSFAISFFGKYGFGRFPVLDRDQRLAGIVTPRNINQSLLLELTRQLDQSSAPTAPAVSAQPSYSLREFQTVRYDFERAGRAAAEMRRLVQEAGHPPALVRRVAVAAYELEMNQVVHSLGGRLHFLMRPGRIEIRAEDTGPGIADVEQALQEGYTTANSWIQSLGFGAGMGLPNARRVADEFALESELGGGTKVRAVFLVPEADPGA
ncbi:MAG: CBS domain-containing protein [Candidatus Marinimicrobia bacterium]|nr:CBS domain-containing protein [Candidatus Neomarinimicrobiota bacterium]